MIFPCHCWPDLTTFYGNYEDTLVLIQYSLLLHRSIILYEFITFLFCQTLVKHVLLTLCHLGKITISAIYHNTTRETEPVKMIFDLKREIMSLINASRLGLWWDIPNFFHYASCFSELNLAINVTLKLSPLELDESSNQAQYHAEEIAKSRPFFIPDISKDQQIIKMIKESEISPLKECFQHLIDNDR